MKSIKDIIKFMLFCSSFKNNLIKWVKLESYEMIFLVKKKLESNEDFK